MPEMNIIQAVNDALHLEMERDAQIVVFGEDVGKFGGVFRATHGLQEKFGAERVFDTPLSEGGIIASAIGMCWTGLRPVPEIQFADFIFPAFDQIVNEAAKMRYRSGGQFTCPITIRTPYGGGIRGGHYHSQSPETYFIHTAGLKVVCPSDPYEAKGLLIAAIRDDNPVLFLEPKRVYRASRAEVPEGDYVLELGKATVAREGADCTLVAWGSMLHTTLEAAEQAQSEDGVSCEVVNMRTLMPFDAETLVASVKKTGRAVVVHEAPRTCGFGAELSATISEKAFLHLEAPVFRVTGLDTPFPYRLEDDYLPNPKRIRQAVRNSIQY